MKKNRTRAIAMIVILAVIGIVLTSLSFAKENENDENITSGTITLNNQRESEYPGLASITLIQAVESGLSKVHGKALKAELEDENGFLVYGIEIVTPENSIIDMKIDAGSGEILSKAVDTDDSGSELSNNEQDNENEGSNDEENNNEDNENEEND